MLVSRIKKISFSLFVLTLALAFCPPESNAENTDKEGYYPRGYSDSFVRYLPSRSVEAMSGKIGIVESETEYDREFKVFDELPVKFSLGTEYIGIKDTLNNIELPARLVGLTAGLEITLPFFNFEQTYLRLGIRPSFYADDWNFKASAFRIPLHSYLIYHLNDRWVLLAGIAAYPDFETEVLPILGFIYKPNDKLTFNIVPKRPNITYSLSDRVGLFAEGGSALNNEFEVSRDNSKNVVLRYKQTRLGAGIEIKLTPRIQASLSGGGVFNRYLKYRDNQGKVSIKDGFYTEFRLEARL